MAFMSLPSDAVDPALLAQTPSFPAPLLTFDHVTLRAGRHDALRDETQTFDLSGVTVLRGPNGAGKTTLLRALLGLISPVHGSIRLFGKPPEKCRALLGYMPQKGDETAPMIPVLSHVAACVDGTRWGMPWPPGSRVKRARELLTYTGAAFLADRPLGVLSGGERQRVALSQALSGAPRLLLLDEPLAALDREARKRMLALLRELRKGLGLSVLMTVHQDLSFEELGGTAQELWLEGGKLRA